ncbi:MAG TPA: ABC transporter ATP-binding protein, partial [Pyrinomonadaceae bacterium]|nr:ABC transporter ATP-binding protein [Pyrinomonadaceae bacterium]
MPEEKKKSVNYKSAWQEAKQLIWAARSRLMIGGLLMIISQLSGLVLPASVRYLVDEVITKKQTHLLSWFALAIGVSTLIQAATTFALSQILGVAAQRAITEMRKRVQAQIERLPINYFDSTQTGQLISRIMSDAEGIRNLVGTGLVQLIGSVITASVAVVFLFYLNWFLTTITLVVLGLFGGVLAFAFNRLRPIFRER